MNPVYTATTTAFNIDGGLVRTRGLWRYNGRGTLTAFNIRNGGTLEVAEFPANSGAIPLTVGEGTIRAYAYGESSGWTYPWTLALTDAANGATIDANGLELVFSGAVTGAGKLTVADSSEAKTGVVRFTSLAAHTGALAVTGGAIDIGTARPKTTIVFAEGTKLILTETLADSDNRVPLAFTGTPSVTMYRADGTTLIEDVTVETDPTTGLSTIVYPTTATPVVSGEACWYDFEFDGRSLASTGRNKSALTRDTQSGIGAKTGQGAAGEFKDETSLYTASQVYMSPTYPTEWSAAVYATVPEYEHAVLMTFGMCDAGLIGLVAGDTAKNEVLLVRTTGNGAFKTLATMAVPNAYSAQHLYVFSKSERTIDIYLDGTLWTTYASETPITFGAGFQIGSVHGNEGNTGLVRFATTLFEDGAENPVVQASSIGMLRLYDSTISNQAIQTLATEFPYVSPNGLYQRTLAGEAVWTSEGDWTKAVEGGEGEAADVPANGAAVQLTATAAATLTIGDAEAPGTIALESLTIGGAGAVTLATAEGTLLVNTGKTVVNTTVTIPHTVSVSGGPLSVSPTASVIFDYRDYELPLNAPNGALALTGIAAATAEIQCLLPKAANAKGRTFKVAYNPTIQCWELQYERGAYTLRWTDGASAAWTADTVWANAADGSDAAFLDGDRVVFGDVAETPSVTITTPAATLGGLLFTNETAGAETDYVLSGGALSVPGIRDVGEGAVSVANAITVAEGGEFYVQGVVKPQVFADVRGTLGTVRVTTGPGETTRGNLTLGSNGTLVLGGETVVNANDDLTLTGSGTLTQTGPLYVAPSATVRKTGTGTYTLGVSPSNGYGFFGSLEVSEGTFAIEHAFNGAAATEENPIRVNGTGRLTVVNGNSQNRLPDSACVVVEDQGVFQVAGNNPFKRDSDLSPTVICRNGGTFQTDGVANNYDVHVWDVRLKDGRLHFAGTAANWANRGLTVDGGTLHSSGDSSLTRQAGSPNVLIVPTIKVADGTLTCALQVGNDLVKTGAGALAFDGAGGATTRNVVVNGGTVIPNQALLDNTTTISFARGTGFDLSAATGPFEAGALAMTGDITLFVGDRELGNNTKLIGWTTAPAETVRFHVKSTVGKSIGVVRKDDGVYSQIGFAIIIR